MGWLGNFSEEVGKGGVGAKKLAGGCGPEAAWVRPGRERGAGWGCARAGPALSTMWDQWGSGGLGPEERDVGPELRTMASR